MIRLQVSIYILQVQMADEMPVASVHYCNCTNIATMIKVALCVCLALLVCFLQQGSATIGDPTMIAVPEQVHISYGAGIDQIWVTWMTFEKESHYKAIPTVQFGVDSAKLDQTAHGKAKLFMNGNRISFVHRVMLSHLKPNTTYHYRCGTQEHGWTKQFSFISRPQDQENWSPKIAMYGDLGLANGVSIPFLKSQIEKHAYDAVFHVGDIAYDLPDFNGQCGDEFMKLMEPVMAALPYQMTVGNHENPNNFSQYDNRFTMINEATGELNNHFYSFNIGPMHVIGFSSEFYFFTNYGTAQIRNQFHWLEQDLKEATKPENRKKHPWIVAMGHRPMYCSGNNHDDCTHFESTLRKGRFVHGSHTVHEYGLEDLFYKYGVDIVIGAHEHNYERLFPLYDRKMYNGSLEEPYRNPKAPVHLIVGSAGCSEEFDHFVKPSLAKPWSAKRIEEYGVGEFHVLNKTHISFKQILTDKKKYGQVADSIMIIKEKHGPEAWF